ncbi:MAG: anti-sigma factor [Mucilaginibacter sp.]|nr:anti-sigma factor [Mucilaginibacter sp.]
MKDVKAYIESGILELYVLGDLNPEERLEVEKTALEYPAVKAELAEIEKTMELFAEEHAIEPSEQLRGKIINSTLVNLGDDRIFTKQRKHSDEEEYEDDKVITMPKRTQFYKYAFAACLTLLLISIYGMVNLYSQLQESNTQLATLQADKTKFANQVNLKDEQLSLYRDTNFRIVRLKGLPKTPAASMVLAWNPSTKKVMVDMQSMKLPKTDTKHEYQLWALVKGKPVDMGVFDNAAVDSAIVKEMKNIASAQGFAVTLEPKGGSVNPTLDQMVVIGQF